MVWTVEIWRWGCWDRRVECSRRWIWRWIWSVWREIWEGGFEWRKRIWFLRIETRWPLCCVCCASLFFVRARERKREQAREREVFGFSDVDWELRRGRRWRRRRRTFFLFFLGVLSRRRVVGGYLTVEKVWIFKLLLKFLFEMTEMPYNLPRSLSLLYHVFFI